MFIYLIRHAIAETLPPASGHSDAERALTEQGVARMRRAAGGLSTLAPSVDRLFSSPLRRARQTAAILAPHWHVDVEVDEALAPEGDLHALALRLAALGGQGTAQVAVVGHQPGLGALASLLWTGEARRAWLPFKKGSVACIELAPPQAMLRWFLPPAQLRALAGGD